MTNYKVWTKHGEDDDNFLEEDGESLNMQHKEQVTGGKLLETKIYHALLIAQTKLLVQVEAPHWICILSLSLTLVTMLGRKEKNRKIGS